MEELNTLLEEFINSPKLDFHVMSLRYSDVILGYPCSFNKNSSLSTNWINRSISFSLNNCQHFIQCVKPSFVSTLSSTYFFDSCSTMYSCVLDPNFQMYNIWSDGEQLTYYKQQVLNSLLKGFLALFPKELRKGLPPKRNIDHHIDLILGTTLVSIPPLLSS